MDPSIMKLLEEDEDESMHCGADVEAFQAALNRDIGGDTSTSHPSHIDSGLESAQRPEQQSTGMDLKQHGSATENQQQQTDGTTLLQHAQLTACTQGSAKPTPNLIPQTTGMQNAEKNHVQTNELERMNSQDGESQFSKVQKMSNQPAVSTEQSSNAIKSGKQVPFALLLPALTPSLDKDRAMQLRTLYARLKKNEINKDVFVRHMRDLVGDQMLRLAVNKMQAQMNANSAPLPSPVSTQQQQLRMPSVTAGSTQFSDPNLFPQRQQKGYNSSTDSAHVPTSSAPMHGANYPMKEGMASKPRELEHQPGSHVGVHVSQISSPNVSITSQDRDRSSIPVQGLNKQQQQHLHFPPTSYPMYGTGGGTYRPFPGTNANTSGSSLKPNSLDAHMRPITHQQSMGSTQPGGGVSLPHFTHNSMAQQNPIPWQASANKDQTSGVTTVAYVKPESADQSAEQSGTQLSTPKGLSAAQVEHGNAIPGTVKDEPLDKPSQRVGFSGPAASVMGSNNVSPTTTQLDPNISLSSRMPSVTSPAGINARTPSKKPTTVSQKKPLETLVSSPPLSNKKPKVSGAFSDQSIEQLNDVTAVSGVNLREEEEQLFSGPKEDSRASEASRRVVQEEEERLILQKTPLQKRLAEIMAKCGLKSMSSDVERCVSLCVEERLRGILTNLIRMSKQRVDAEKPRHRTIITSDVRQQIMKMNRKAKEEWEKKQAEAEKLRKPNESDGEDGDGDKDKDSKSVKVNKEEDDKMRTTAANVAARAAVGGDDVLSKWQLMAEQARQKREGGGDAASSSQAGKEISRRPPASFGRNIKDNQEAERRGHAHAGAGGGVRKFGRNQVAMPQTRVAHTISVKDVIGVLEREPQMSKSTLIYRLYDKIGSDNTAPE